MEEITLNRGEVYLARLDQAKHVEIGEIRPVVLSSSIHLSVVLHCAKNSHQRHLAVKHKQPSGAIPAVQKRATKKALAGVDPLTEPALLPR